MKSLRGMLSALLILIFSGCNLPGKVTPAVISSTPSSPTATMLVSQPVNSTTTSPTQTTATSTAFTPEVILLGADWLGSGHLMVSLLFPEPISLNYRAAADETEFKCRGLKEQTNQLICTAFGLREGSDLEFVVFDTSSDQEVFLGNIFVPYQHQNESGNASRKSTQKPSGTNQPPGTPKPTQP